MHNFLNLLGEKRGVFALLTFCTVVVTGAEAALHPLLMKAIFDAVSAHRDFGIFLELGAYYLALGLVVNGLNYLLSLWRIRIDNSISASVSARMLEAFYAKSYNTVIREGEGYYVARIRSDVKDGLLPMLSATRSLIVSSVTFAVLLSVLIYISLQAFLILAVIIPISTAITIIVGKKIRKLTDVERDTEASLVDVLTRSVGAFKMVRIFGLHAKTMGTFSTTINHALESNFRKLRVVRGLQTVGDLTMVISDVCSIFVGGFLVLRNQLTLGSFIAFMNAFWRAATTLISIFNVWAELHGYIAIIDRISAFTERSRDPVNHDVDNRVDARAITFAYGEAPVVNDFSFAMEPGERALILGENGAGKTTLANILSGLLSQSEGLLTLPAAISAMTLPVRFPPTTVQELPVDRNLLSTLGVASQAILNSRPDELSAGQQQKIAIALTLSKEADLYILDEPLSNLDKSSSELAMKAILERTQGKMLAVIMHNAEPYKSLFDRIVFINVNREPVDKAPLESDLREYVGR
jgi:ATP-binding cassette subfamily B protein